MGNGKTVVRAGGELAYDKPNFFTGQRAQQNPPFATAISNTQTSGSAPLNFGAPWSVGQFTTSPFPQPVVPTPSQAQFFAQSQYIVMPKQFLSAYTIQWTLSVQHQFGRGWQGQVDYIGNRTVHDPMGTPLSPALYIGYSVLDYEKPGLALYAEHREPNAGQPDSGRRYGLELCQRYRLCEL